VKSNPTRFIALILITCLTIIPFSSATWADDAPTIAVPPDWASTTKRHTQVLSRTYPDGKITIHVFPWVDADGQTARSWAQTISSQAVRGERITSGVHTAIDVPDSELVYVVRDARAKRGNKRVSIQFACAQSGKLRLVDSYMDADLLRDGRQKVTVPAVTEVAKAACSQVPILIQPTPDRPDFAAGTGPDDMDAIWYVAKFIPTIDGFQSRRKGVVTFNDKQATDDIRMLFAEGRAASMRENPGDWGPWRIRKGDLTVDWNEDGDFSEFFLSIKTDPGKQDDRAQGCFGSTTFSSLPLMGQGEFNTAVAINTWCFATNGRFSNESMVAINASTGDSPLAETRTDASGYSNRDRNGWYRIDGHVLQLVYDNGATATTSIAFIDRDDPEKRAILLGSRYLD